MRHTKIVATLGPATKDDAALDAVIAAGVDVVRLNFSHGTYDTHRTPTSAPAPLPPGSDARSQSCRT